MGVTVEELWSRWGSDFDEAQQDVYTLLHTRWMWRVLSDLLAKGNPTSYAVVTNYLTRTYVATVCMGVRREADPRSVTSSLARCLDVLLDRPSLVSRELFAARARAYAEEVDERDIRASFRVLAPGGKDQIERAVLRAWRDELTTNVDPVKTYTDKVLAHRQRNGVTEELTPSWDDINQSLNTVGLTLKRLHGVRNPCQMLASATPVADPGFVKMFDHAWYTPDWTLPPILKDEV